MAYTIHFYGQVCTVVIATSTYKNGTLAVQLLDAASRESLWTLSLHIPHEPLEPGEFIFKTYSENAGLLEQLAAQGVVRPTGRLIAVGLAGDLPVYRLCL